MILANSKFGGSHMTTNERIEKLILPACEVIRDTFDNPNEIDAQARSKMSAFGASIIMGSLKSTIMNYCDEKADDTDINKNLMECLWKLLRKPGYFDFHYEKEFSDIAGFKKFVISNKDYTDEIEEDILVAATVIKMALNLFPFKKKEGDAE